MNHNRFMSLEPLVQLGSLMLVFIMIQLMVSCGPQGTGEDSTQEFRNSYPLLSPDSGYSVNVLNGDSLFDWIKYDGDTIRGGNQGPIESVNWDFTNLSPPEKVKIPSPTRVETNLESQKLGTPVRTFKAQGRQLEKQIQAETIKLDYTEEPVKVVRTWAGNSDLKPDPASMTIEHFGTRNGLTSDFIQTSCVDSYGKIWFADDGLISFDGNTFREFQTLEKELGPVKVIEVDANNHIWLADVSWSYDGVREFDGKVLRRYTDLARTRQKHNNAENLFADGVGRMWIRQDSSIYRINTGYMRRTLSAPWLDENAIVNVFTDTADHLWVVAGTDNRYGVWNGSEFISYTLPQTPTAAASDQLGNVWIGSHAALFKHRPDGTIEEYTYLSGLLESPIMEIHADRKDRLWVRYGNGDIHIIDDGHIRKLDAEKIGWFYPSNPSLRYRDVRHLTEDMQGQIWISTFSNGMSICKSSRIENLFLEPSVPGLLIRDMAQDQRGRIWLSTSHGIYMHNTADQSTYKYDFSSAYPDGYDARQLVIRDGKVWFGLNFKLNCFDGDSLTIYWNNTDFVGSLHHLVVDSNGTLWGGGFSNLWSFDGKQFRQELPELDYEDAELSIDDLLVGPDNNIIASLNYVGPAIYDHKSWHFISKKMGAFFGPGCLLALGYGRYMYGTSNSGVFYFDSTRFVRISIREGLSDNYICSMTKDRDEQIWILTDRGYNKIAMESLDQYIEGTSNELDIQHYDNRDGFFYNTSVDNSGSVEFANQLWLNNKSCISIIDKREMVSPFVPKLQISDIKLNEQAYTSFDLDFGEGIEYGELDSNTGAPKGLKVKFWANHITFHFSYADLAAPHRVRYSYRIEELEKKWSEPSIAGVADYRSLPPGKYHLNVRAKGQNNIWSQAVIFPFEVLPPWYRTDWAYVFYLVISGFLLWLFVRYRTAVLRKDKEKLEKVVTERTAEVVAEKNRSEELLLNILPEEVAEELKAKGSADAQLIDQVTVLFTDFKGFTSMSEQLSPKQLIEDLNECFSEFDRIVGKFGIEKIKTIGDAYMAAGGLPTPNKTHARDVLEAAFEMRDFVENGKARKIKDGRPYFEIRVGIHSGPVVAGIVGIKKFQYDIWGDTVNTASRMESSGEVGKVNISQAIYELLKDDADFSFENRGKIEAKGKGDIEMYFVSKN